MIPSDFIDELLSKVDIVDIIDEQVPLKKGGANYMACCPFHKEKNAVVFGQPDQAVLPLLQLRGAWFGDWFCDGTSGAVVSGGGAVFG